MKMNKGVELLLKPRTRIPKWIRNQTLNIKIDHTQLYGRRVRFLKIRNGVASFSPGGSVAIKMPGSGEFWVAFLPLKVLEIRDLQGNLIKRNHKLCTKCATLTGEMKGHKPGTIAGREDAIFQCTHCGHQWELENI